VSSAVKNRRFSPPKPKAEWWLTRARHRVLTTLLQGYDLWSIVCSSAHASWISTLRLAAGHPRLTTKAHPPMKPLPLGAPHHLSTVRHNGRIRLPRVSSLLNDIPRTSPV
jgi:hypothetical protein